ncbi:predicted protein [Streptomyces viridosporus ATCC 14672]|uniref:Predicted protein n=1 Tax=Streptomyces viridosporus (strain ATCC 14672 / DSM 40746 / JCM 4963 / KCTC 9882 / NRRL B-12104 / FH 1290) TaxID=566461 RepID=D5ZX12_STRV1|nr:predicted protein [Streptomyces viridosporus ATCC 14672]
MRAAEEGDPGVARWSGVTDRSCRPPGTASKGDAHRRALFPRRRVGGIEGPWDSRRPETAVLFCAVKPRRNGAGAPWPSAAPIGDDGRPTRENRRVRFFSVASCGRDIDVAALCRPRRHCRPTPRRAGAAPAPGA